MARYKTCRNSVHTAWPNGRNICKEKGDGSIVDVRCLCPSNSGLQPSYGWFWSRWPV